MNISIPDFGFDSEPRNSAQINWQSPQSHAKNFNKQIQLQLTNSPANNIQQANIRFQDGELNSHNIFLNELQKLYFEIETTKYTLEIEEFELQNLKSKQNQIQKSINKIDRKFKEKNQKELELKRAQKLHQERKQKLNNGFKALQKERNQMKNQQIKTRSKRIQAQESKNAIYKQYVESEEEYRHLLEQIHDLQGVDENVDEIHEQNQYLKENIERISQVLFGEEREEYNQQRKNIREEIKFLNEAAINLQNQQKSLLSQISSIEQYKKTRELDQIKIREKSDYGFRLAKKIQQLKTELTEKRAELTQIDSIYRQISIEENKLKKQIILERQCRQEQKRYKQRRKKDMESTGFGRHYTPRNQTRNQGLETRNQLETKMSRQNKVLSTQSNKINEQEMRKLQRLFQRYENVSKGC